MLRAFDLTRLLVTLIAATAFASTALAEKPNILIILTDDLGYGDVAIYNPDSKVPTPQIDKLAKQGMMFTDAHSPSTVCTPTRYSLMTGQMCFRIGYRGVFTGVGGPCLIKDERYTIAEMLQDAGYATALFGKWHIGITAYDSKGEPIHQGGIKGVQRTDYSRPFDGGPIDHGFDHFYGTVSCPTTDWLYAYIDGDRVPVPPTESIDKDKYPKNPYTGDFRRGKAAPNFEADKVDLVFMEKSLAFMRDHVKKTPDKPFFLLHSMQAVHLPSIPPVEFRGKTDAGPHGDFIYMMDWVVGELMKELETLGIADNTLVVFCSDNGPEVPTVIHMRRDHGHDGARPWRGVKRDQWEGGHRTPFIVKWPAKVEAGTTSDQPLSLTDLFATFATIVGKDLPTNTAEDSFDILPVLTGEATEPVRPFLLTQTWSNALAIRVGDWKYLDHKGGAGSNYTKDGTWGMKQYALPELDPDAPGQLYNLKDDPGETTNLYSKHPEIVAKLKGMLDATVESGRSAPKR